VAGTRWKFTCVLENWEQMYFTKAGIRRRTVSTTASLE
jgi:hypothetical protein